MSTRISMAHEDEYHIYKELQPFDGPVYYAQFHSSAEMFSYIVHKSSGDAHRLTLGFEDLEQMRRLRDALNEALGEGDE